MTTVKSKKKGTLRISNVSYIDCPNIRELECDKIQISAHMNLKKCEILRCGDYYPHTFTLKNIHILHIENVHNVEEFYLPECRIFFIKTFKNLKKIFLPKCEIFGIEQTLEPSKIYIPSCKKIFLGDQKFRGKLLISFNEVHIYNSNILSVHLKNVEHFSLADSRFGEVKIIEEPDQDVSKIDNCDIKKLSVTSKGKIIMQNNRFGALVGKIGEVHLSYSAVDNLFLSTTSTDLLSNVINSIRFLKSNSSIISRNILPRKCIINSEVVIIEDNYDIEHLSLPRCSFFEMNGEKQLSYLHIPRIVVYYDFDFLHYRNGKFYYHREEIKGLEIFNKKTGDFALKTKIQRLRRKYFDLWKIFLI